MKLDSINNDTIEEWFDYMTGEEYKNTYINGNFAILKVMIKWAVKKEFITADPTKNIEKLINDRKPIKIITTDEFRALFIKDWRGVWDNDRIACLGNKLAALTGMRAGEVLGLRGEYLFDTHLYLCAQYDKFGYRETKTKFKHNVPLPPRMVEELNELKAINGQGFIFSTNGGASPVNNRYLYDGLLDALEKIGMSEGEIKERGLCFHAWRHFCNTELHKAGLSIQQVQAVTGHKTERMSEWYCHFDPMEFTEVPKVQNDLLGIKSEKPEQSPAVALHIVKTEAQQSA
jgi:integrase